MTLETVFPDPTVFIGYADSGPGFLVEARSGLEARAAIWAHPIFRTSAAGVVLYSEAPEKEKVAAGIRGWLIHQTAIIPTFLAAKTDPPRPLLPPKAEDK